MKEYTVKYKLGGYGYLTVVAESEEDAMEEIDRVMCGDEPTHPENSWVSPEVVWDIEYTTCETVEAEEV